MAQSLDIFDVTPSMVPRRPAHPLTAEQHAMLERLDVVVNGPRRPQPVTPTRRCTRCGIDTTWPNLCRDCTDVTFDLGTPL